MNFIDKIRESAGKTKYKMYQLLQLESPQAYISLFKSKERITFVTLIKLRKNLGLTNTQLLDMIEAELTSLEVEESPTK